MKLNNIEYKMPQMTFNNVCKLEEMGVSLTEIDKKPMAAIRGLLALAVGDPEKAGRELEAHLEQGGDLQEILDEVVKAVNESGFFRALAQKSQA